MQLLDMAHAANSYSRATNSTLGICYGHPSITFISKESEVYVLYDTNFVRFYSNEFYKPSFTSTI